MAKRKWKYDAKMEPDFPRKILYDFMYNRFRVFGWRQYDRFDDEQRKVLRKYYTRHTCTVIGLGKRLRGFWVPQSSSSSGKSESNEL